MPAPGLAAAAAFFGALVLSACTPPPTGLTQPAVSEADTIDETESAAIGAPLDRRLVALRVTIDNPPPELLDPQDAGVLTLQRQGERGRRRFVFINGALGVYALQPGVYKLGTVAGYECGKIHLSIPKRNEILFLGGLNLEFHEEPKASLSGELPTRDDVDRVADLIGADEESIEIRPLERRSGISCVRNPWAVARPDFDPNIRKMTPAEIVGAVALVGILGAATGGAIAAGSIVFVSGNAGGLLFLAI